MKRLLPVLLVAASSLASIGCATISYHERLGDRGREVWEFEKLDSHDKAYEGTAEERAVINNKSYYHLQFEGPLAGSGRYLDIFIPNDDKDQLVISESAAKVNGKKKAFLLVERYCCSEGYKDIFELYNVPSIAAPAQTIKRLFRADVEPKDFPVYFFKLTFSNVKKFNAHSVVWSLANDGSAKVDQGYHLEQPYSMIDVKWKQRNLFVNGLIKVGYVAPVLADIISSPIQLIGVIIYFAMGGAVK